MGAGRLRLRARRLARRGPLARHARQLVAAPGTMAFGAAREARDLYLCIEWAGTQPWSAGKVGLDGISYFATNQWQVGALRPPHLAALCVWEGFSDYYRELARHGGILSQFVESWYGRQVLPVQHGVGDKGPRSQ